MPTLAVMREKVIAEAGAEGHLDPTDPDDAAYVDAFLNSALQSLHDLLAGAFQDYKLASANGTIASAAVAEFALPAGLVLKVRDVEWLGSAGTSPPVSLKSLPWMERNTHISDRRYCLAGEAILIRPTRLSIGSYKLWYTPRFVELVADGDTYDSINGWETLAVLDAAIRIRDNGMEKDASMLVARSQSLATEITEAASRRVTGSPSRVRMTKKSPLERLLMADLDPDRYG